MSRFEGDHATLRAAMEASARAHGGEEVPRALLDRCAVTLTGPARALIRAGDALSPGASPVDPTSRRQDDTMMELMQWIVPLEEGELAVGWAPAWADSLPALGRLPRGARRRGAPLVSRWLPCPLVVGALEVEAAERGQERELLARPAPRATSMVLHLGIALDGDAREPVVAPRADDLRFAGLFSELVRVMADLSEAAGVPVVGVTPALERRGVALRLGALGSLTVQQLGDAVLLLRVAVEVGLQARGLQLTDADLLIDGARVPVDGRLAQVLARMV